MPHIPVITMSQNMLPFESKEAILFGGLSLMRCKLKLLRIFQSQAFKRADGVIFLTQYAKDKINLILGGITNLSTIIPHGIERRFFCPPRLQIESNNYTFKNPFCYLYVSILMPYKHQIEIAKAIYNLRNKGFPVKVRFAGASWGAYGREFNALIARLDPAAEFLIWDGDVSFNQLHSLYKKSDAFIFGSSCENLPNIMIEAMASGLPIASSLHGPMPEVLGEAGVYFDPYNPSTIELALSKLFSDFELRSRLSSLAYEKSISYSWENCAKKTLEFIAIVNKRYGSLNV
jgi:glycosyltransferase involved in cell wall biosynthesis